MFPQRGRQQKLVSLDACRCRDPPVQDTLPLDQLVAHGQTTPLLFSLRGVAPWHMDAVQVRGTAARVVESRQPIGVCAHVSRRDGGTVPVAPSPTISASMPASNIPSLAGNRVVFVSSSKTSVLGVLTCRRRDRASVLALCFAADTEFRSEVRLDQCPPLFNGR